MKNLSLILALFVFCSASACNQSGNSSATNDNLEKTTPDEKTLFKEIKALEKKLSKATDVKDEMNAAKDLVIKSRSFGEYFPENEKTPEVLFRGADVARGIGEYGRAIQMWGQVWRKYPDFERAPDAMFLQAFTYENNLKDYANAKSYYIEFLEKHQKHPLYEQAKTALANLGKTPEDLIKEFQKNNEK